MYYSQNILRPLAATSIALGILFISFFAFMPSAHALSLGDRVQSRFCAQAERIFGRFPASLVRLPDFCTPPPPPVLPTVEITVEPASITEGESAVLSWTSTNADSCTASGGWSGEKETSGEDEVSPMNTATYTLTCENEDGEAADSATLTVTPLPEESTLTLVKTVVNDNGGTAATTSFQAKIGGADVPWGVAQTVPTGTHTVSETTLSGYTASVWGGDCAADGTVTLAAGENKICTITNDDQPGTLIVKKVVINDDGGTAEADEFSFQVNGGVAVFFEPDGQNDLAVAAGVYTVSEPSAAGYATSYENCASVAVANGETEICTITNNDVAPLPTTGTLTVDKITVPGGSLAEFEVMATGTGAITGGGAGVITDATSVEYEVAPGTYSVSEAAVDGWIIVENTCTDVAVAAGGEETCTITNAQLPTLTVVKVVVNDDGGELTVSDFPLFIDGEQVLSWATTTVATGTRAVSETNDAGYTATYGGDCDTNGMVTLAYGDVKTCTITNDDIAPAPMGKLLITEVLYDLATSTPAQGTEPANEWIEIYNGTDSEVDLSEYTLHDSGASVDSLPEETILPAGGFLIVTASSTTESFYEFPEGTVVVVLSSSIATSGLGNTGDLIELRDRSGVHVDSVSWGTEEGDVPLVDENAGHSIRRVSVMTDTGSPDDWEEIETPTPGAF